MDDVLAVEVVRMCDEEDMLVLEVNGKVQVAKESIVVKCECSNVCLGD